MKIKPTKVKEEDKKRYVMALDALYTTISELGDREEVKKFLKQLLTESEKIMLGRRILIAQMLLRDIGYEKIVEELKVGMDTIMRVHRWLQNEEEGIEKAVRKLENAIQSRRKIRSEKGPADPFSFEGIKRRYPIHSLLFNIFDELK